MEISKTIVQVAKENKEERCWEIIMTTTLSRKITEEAEAESVEFSVKTYDTDLERGIQVLHHATDEHFNSGEFNIPENLERKK